MRTGNPWRAVTFMALLAVLATACAPSASPSPTAAPAKPAAPTSAPAEKAAPAAPAATAAPKEAAKPAEKPAAKAAITLRGLSSWERNIVYTQPFLKFIDRIKEKTNGELQMTYAGPEVVPPFEAMTAVSKGVYDFAHTATSYYVTNMPEGTALQFAMDSCQKLRGGALDLLEQLHRQKTNTTFMGCIGGGFGFVFLTKEPIDSLDFFKGKKIRGDQLRVPIIQELGAAAVVTAPAEVYTALERKIVDGVIWPENGILERKWDEVAKYLVGPSWMDVRQNYVMNIDAYNKLPPHLQKALRDTIDEEEVTSRGFYRQEVDKEQVELKKKGMQFQTLAPADAQKLLKLVNDVVWRQIEKDSPEWGSKLHEAFTKAGVK